MSFDPKAYLPSNPQNNRNNPNNDPNSSEDSLGDEFGLWGLKSNTTQSLLAKKMARDHVAGQRARLREAMRDPLRRLRAFYKHAYIQQQQSQPGTAEGGKRGARDGDYRKKGGSGGKVVYEWDIQSCTSGSEISSRSSPTTPIYERGPKVPKMQTPSLTTRKSPTSATPSSKPTTAALDFMVTTTYFICYLTYE
jgi:hypothetical protein